MELAIDILGLEGQILTGDPSDVVGVAAQAGPGRLPGERPAGLVLLLPVGDHLGRNGRDPAQHRGRTGARPAQGAQAGDRRLIPDGASDREQRLGVVDTCRPPRAEVDSARSRSGRPVAGPPGRSRPLPERVAADRHSTPSHPAWWAPSATGQHSRWATRAPVPSSGLVAGRPAAATLASVTTSAASWPRGSSAAANGASSVRSSGSTAVPSSSCATWARAVARSRLR